MKPLCVLTWKYENMKENNAIFKNVLVIVQVIGHFN